MKLNEIKQQSAFVLMYSKYWEKIDDDEQILFHYCSFFREVVKIKRDVIYKRHLNESVIMC